MNTVIARAVARKADCRHVLAVASIITLAALAGVSTTMILSTFEVPSFVLFVIALCIIAVAGFATSVFIAEVQDTF